MRSSKLHEPQPYLEPNSPRSKMVARGILASGEESSTLSIAIQAMGLDIPEDQQEHKLAMSSEKRTNSDSGVEGDGGDGESIEQTEAVSSSTPCEGSEGVRLVVTEEVEEQRGPTESLQRLEPDQLACVTLRVPPKMRVCADDSEEVKVKPTPGSLYADLGDFEPVNLLSFAYQIASGMVRERSINYTCITLQSTENVCFL